ncbi:iduronate 2-sulfatase isoform X2 [Frieseomelitta varia]|uniref:iduronate 2-sulfatase isoform X2 n=1 Tax=Frieseomelitta varia TaxID=561572 RepID=UPI001CB683CE|nr:iduronate 2-sulfatase isoform X2 [Frieseomelitta varia]
MSVTLCFVSLIVWCTAERQNFLLIIVDDLRTTLGCYGDIKAYTPNIDRLATEAAIFSQAFAQQALCAPSRNSFLTSRRPDTLQLYDFYSYWRKNTGNFTTLPQHLKNNGYITKSIGKVFHPGISSNNSDDNLYSWSETPFHPFTERYKDAPICQTNKQLLPAQNLLCPVKVSSMPNKTLPDIEILKEAKNFLSNQTGNNSPFFLAVGFQKPHIPFKYPKKYIKYHPLQKFEVPEPYKWSDNVSSIAYNPWNDLRKREDVAALNLKFPWEKIPRWSLGEHAVWAKYSNYDVALKVPLIISIPELTHKKSKDNTNVNDSSARTQTFINSIVELVDIFPTIADLANISIPICSNETTQITCSEGTTFVPLIRAALKNETISWKKAAFGQYPRPSIEPSIRPNSDEPRLKEIKAMGYTLRTNKYRYTAWLSFDPKSKLSNWSNIIAEELYDHNNDKGENRNVAFLERYMKLKEKLKILLQHGWRNVLSDEFNL